RLRRPVRSPANGQHGACGAPLSVRVCPLSACVWNRLCGDLASVVLEHWPAGVADGALAVCIFVSRTWRDARAAGRVAGIGFAAHTDRHTLGVLSHWRPAPPCVLSIGGWRRNAYLAARRDTGDVGRSANPDQSSDAAFAVRLAIDHLRVRAARR